MADVITIAAGAVRGRRVGGAHVFLGVPYAAPPVGRLRLLPPQAVESWTGVRDAFAFGPKFPQPEYPAEVAPLLPPEDCAQGEDCLLLNIWSPAPGAAALPVMVWIPGGMYAYHATGASPWYDGSRFARDGVVCVTINYRVAIDGFLYLGDGNANRGLLDQIAALQWVQDNIAAFGGDPGNVTIFGESAGAMSVSTLLAMPRAQGLFRRAIAQSGAGHHALPVDAARKVGDRLAERLGVPIWRDTLSGLPLARILQAQTELEADLATRPDPERWGMDVVAAMMPWQPVIDGDSLPARPIDCVADGASAQVDLMVGTNVDEHRLFLVPGGIIDHITPEALAGAAAAVGLPVDVALAGYRAERPGATHGDVLAALQSDWFWRIPAMRLADAHAPGAGATFMYEFAWPSPQFDGRLGACHALEIPFVFDTLGRGTEHLWGATPPQQLANTMHAAWVAFARCGNPGWPRYDQPRRATMHFDVSSGIVNDPLASTRALWDGVR
jgi:para-nitrobenzyl esterase